LKTYEEALAFIHGRTKFKKIPTLDRMNRFLELLGNPHQKIQAIHIAGTNGKGSTLTYLRNIMQADGYSVGTYTSPFLIKFNERISVDGQPIADEEILRLANLVKPVVDQLDDTLPEGGPTEFEIITAMMFSYFAEGHADIVLVEVGLGGLYDSTNVVTPLASAITSIGYDHMQILGNTLSEIAAQKAGIIKPSVPVVVGKLENDPFEVIAKTAANHDSQLFTLGKEFDVSTPKVENWQQSFEYSGFNTDIQLTSQLLGDYQAQNAAIAISLYFVYCKLLKKKAAISSVLKGVANAQWAGRFERISTNPTIVIDGAHNVPAAKQLTTLLNNSYSKGKIYMIIAVLADKQAQEIVSEMAQVKNAEITLTTFQTPMNRKLFDANLVEKQEANKKVAVTYQPDFKSAITKAEEKMNSDDLLLVTGSLYFISEVRAYLLKYHEQI